MNELQVFKFENKEVRTIVENGEPWFVAKDVAVALEYPETSNPARLFAHVPDEWKGVHPIHTPECEVNPIHISSRARKSQNMLCLSEQGLYFFLGRSDKPGALPFQKLVAGEVMPAIRKTGTYTVPGREPPPVQLEGPWNYYPFFRRLDLVDSLDKLQALLDSGQISLDEFRGIILARPDGKPVKVLRKPLPAPGSREVAYQKTVSILTGPAEGINPDVRKFVEEQILYTGSREDFVRRDDAYDRFKALTGSALSRNKFIRQVRRFIPEDERSQKKLDGEPVLVLYGVKLKEHDQR
jgi:prophage antirepressor-like protein